MEENFSPVPETKSEQDDIQMSQIIEKKEKPKKEWGMVFLIVLLIIFFPLCGVLIGWIAGGKTNNSLNNLFGHKFEQAAPRDKQMEVLKKQVIEEDSAVIDVVEDKSPAVVSIIISKEVSMRRNIFDNPFGFPSFFGNNSTNGVQDGAQDTQKQKIGGGSGFIIGTDGMIVTNKHVVIDKNADYTVVTSDGKEYAAKFLASDPINDIAILKIDGSDFPILELGDSDALKAGQTVIAIGNSLGEFSNTVSKGIVSGLGRNVTASGGYGTPERLTNIIQTDAAINPGNSGGPLLNIEGEVIGVNVAMAEGAQSIGFAIPSNQIKKIISQVKETGKISHPYIGVRYVELDEALKKQIDVPYNYGVLVVRGQQISDFAVIPGSPADKAGIVENDVILEINGTRIDKKNSLVDLIAKYNVGDTISAKIWHKGDVKDITMKLEERK